MSARQPALQTGQQAYVLPGGFPDQAFAEEYITLLNEAERYEQAWTVFEETSDIFEGAERLQLNAGVAALHLGKQEFLQRLFATEWAVVREGEMILVELWYASEARQTCPPPATINFRMT